ncbi:MAG: hypothetical protein WCX65_06020 [bacterium]
MKHIRIVLIATIALYAACAAAPVRAASPLNPNGLSFEAGKIQEKDGRSDLYFASLIPQFSIGRVTTVLNINYIATNKYKLRKGSHNFFVLDSLNYDGGDNFNFRYGEIKNLTLGSGFIVSNYRSDILGNVPLNRQRGVELDIKSAESYIKAFGTQSDLFGIRGVRSLGSLRLGATGVSAANPNFDEVGVDIETHFKNERIKFYAETAKIIKRGDGSAFGAIVKPKKSISLRGELRDFSSDFIPSIVDERFEAGSPFYKTIGSARTHGIFTAVDFAPNPENSLGLTYELYENRQPRTTVKARGLITPSLSGDLFYAQENLVPKSGWIRPKYSIARCILTYKLNNKIGLVLDYYRAFDETRDKQESLTFKTRIKFH